MKLYLYKLIDLGCWRSMAVTYTAACKTEDKNRAGNHVDQFSMDDKCLLWGNWLDNNNEGSKDGNKPKHTHNKDFYNNRL